MLSTAPGSLPTLYNANVSTIYVWQGDQKAKAARPLMCNRWGITCTRIQQIVHLSTRPSSFLQPYFRPVETAHLAAGSNIKGGRPRSSVMNEDIPAALAV